MKQTLILKLQTLLSGFVWKYFLTQMQIQFEIKYFIYILYEHKHLWRQDVHMTASQKRETFKWIMVIAERHRRRENFTSYR